MKAARRTAIKKRLAELRPEVELRRQVNYNLQRERQRRTFAANAQNLYDRYENAVMMNPNMDGLRLLRLNQHKEKTEDPPVRGGGLQGSPPTSSCLLENEGLASTVRWSLPGGP